MTVDNNQSVSEFELIKRYFLNIGKASSLSSAIDVDIGDDCAVLSVAEGKRLAFSIDTLVAGKHFPEQADAVDIAQRALAVSISDLAAMGATPLAFTLALTLPAADVEWLQKFSDGLAKAADHYAIALIGGDTTQGPLSITIQVHGELPAHSAIQRKNAQPGDVVFVSGSLGDAAAALMVIDSTLSLEQVEHDYLLQRYYQPEVRIKLGESLLTVATAAIDISDGLLADVMHIAQASNVIIQIDAEKLPLSSAIKKIFLKEEREKLALTGGDDYELCFTAPPSAKAQINNVAKSLGVAITEIGRVVDRNNSAGGEEISGDLQNPMVRCVDADGNLMKYDRNGYQHF